MADKAIAVVVCMLAFGLAAWAQSPAERAEVPAHASDTPDPITGYGVNGTEGENGWYVSGATVWCRVNGTVNYSLDDVEWSEYAVPILLDTDGEHTVEFRGYINETANETVRLDIKIDRVAPVSTAVYDNETLHVTFESSDATSGVASTMYSIDGVAWKKYTGPFGLSAGEHSVQYYSVDAAGNAETAKTISMTVPAKVKVFEAVVILAVLGAGLAAFLLMVWRSSKRFPRERDSKGGSG